MKKKMHFLELKPNSLDQMITFFKEVAIIYRVSKVESIFFRVGNTGTIISNGQITIHFRCLHSMPILSTYEVNQYLCQTTSKTNKVAFFFPTK